MYINIHTYIVISLYIYIYIAQTVIRGTSHVY